MTTNTIHNRPNMLAAFKGALLGHAIAAQKGLTHDKHASRIAGSGWPDEVFYAQFVARSYLQDKTPGHLDMVYMRSSLKTGLAIEGRQQITQKHPCEVATDFRWNPREQRKKREQRVGGPGVAAHAIPVGLVNRNEFRKIIREAGQIGRLTHHQPLAISAGAVTAMAIALAVTEGNDPSGIIHRLMSALKSPNGKDLAPWRLMHKMKTVERLLEEKLSTAAGIRELCDDPGRTALDVVPGAIFAALNGSFSFEDLMEGLAGVKNYKFWAIAGGLRGAMIGAEAIPRTLLTGLEDVDCILGNAEALYRVTV
jgi:hypothetical protein